MPISTGTEKRVLAASSNSKVKVFFEVCASKRSDTLIVMSVDSPGLIALWAYLISKSRGGVQMSFGVSGTSERLVSLTLYSARTESRWIRSMAGSITMGEIESADERMSANNVTFAFVFVMSLVTTSADFRCFPE